ncbi:MAG TPA: tetratricopeptide repeat protein [Usitatibacter sp.]|nr:tetratricopeptide repeat protein [Usitatibacter sp.]
MSVPPAASPQVRRNDPCPCGSGRRYKECHGKLAVAPLATDALARNALAAHQQGRIDEAERLYREILAREPGHPVATHYMGLAAWQRGDVRTAEERMRAALAANASIPDFHNNLGLLLRDTGRVEEAIACFRRTLEVDPGWFEAHNNLGLALEAAGRFEAAVDAYRAGIAAQPAFAPARQNLGRALLALGRYGEGWAEYRWRLLAQGLSRTPPYPAATRLPASLAGRSMALVSEQGLGDVLFFLRFAPELAARGARLAFRGDARLHGMLSRTGHFALGLDADGAPAPGLEPVPIGDLPWLLGADDPAGFPPPLRLAAREDRVAQARASLEAQGPRPWVALTWRGGVASAGPSRTQVKEAPLDALGAALRGLPATWIGVQRLPREGEYGRIADAIGAPVHDRSAVNDALEDMLALLACCDRYVTVSNANVHLRAGVGGPVELLVPQPPEWRWGVAGERSPWFPEAAIHRQGVDGDWGEALGSLSARLHAALHRG